MSAEFTGERVIPHRVDPDLWNEHFARYAFASRLANNRRVLDAGCGSGYGAAELGAAARSVIAIDLSAEAVTSASKDYARANIRWIQASCTSLPVPDASCDLLVAFEVIEHLIDWPMLLDEAKRVLAPGGQFVVSTPNKSFYAESRSLSGPNPFHEHEFEYEEFRSALAAVFPHVRLYAQDHTEGLLFQVPGNKSPAEVLIENAEYDIRNSNFYIAICSADLAVDDPATFVYLPAAGNLLKERGTHIRRLESELQVKDDWLTSSRSEHESLVGMFREQTTELEQRNAWAGELNAKLMAAGQRIDQVQKELAHEQTASAEVAAAYAAKVVQLEADVEARTAWALETETKLNAELGHKCAELAECVKVLHETEATLEARTAWAQQLDHDRERAVATLHMVQASRWVRLGRTIGVGPEIQNS